MADTEIPVYREINIGRVTGLSSYELAVAHGKFTGTEEEFVEKEMEMFNKITDAKEEIDQTVEGVKNISDYINLRLNYLGYITEPGIIDTILDTYKIDDSVIKDKSGGFSYTFNSTDGMYFGYEQDRTHGVQARLSWVHGFDIRTKNDSETWSDWDSSVFHSSRSTSKEV